MPDELTVERIDIANLGEEHFANCVLRAGRDEDRAVAWGDRIVEMPLTADAPVREVVAMLPDQRYSNGGCALDVDHDGFDEIVVARGPIPGTEPENPTIDLLWFEEVPGSERWEEHVLATIPVESAWQAPHDIVPFCSDPRGAITGVVVVVGRERLLWYETPDDPTAPWQRHEIGEIPTEEKQSGVCVGDVAGHGPPDVVCGMFWAECPADPRADEWTIRRYGHFDANEWGGMAKTAVEDLDGDGRTEIIAGEAEIPGGRLAVFRRQGGVGVPQWECHVLSDSLYAPHSLVITDIDGDGAPDIVVGEMECAGWDFERTDNPRIIAWLQREDLQFEQVTLAHHAGIHEMTLVPSAGGETVLLGCDETQPHKLDGMETTVYMLRVTS